MGQPYVGEIRMFAGTFEPVGWLFCQGQQLPISENEVLFQLIGTQYGGDGQSTFNLPNLASRIPIHMSGTPGATYVIGEMAGTEQETLTIQQIPTHSHPMLASADTANTLNVQGNVVSAPLTSTPYLNGFTPAVALNAQAVSPVGGSQPHENTQPFLCINFIISLYGIFPSQT